jgi:Ser/Thr protein kinase RdoA (MazF antagonist)
MKEWTMDDHEAVTDWVRAAYADGSARVVGSATRTTGLALRVRLGPRAMWLRAGGVVQRSLELTEREGKVAAELGAAGLAVPVPIARADGAFAGMLPAGKRQWPAIGYAELSGEEVLTPTAEQAEALGGLLRGLHEWAPSATANALPWVEPLEKIEERLREAGHWLDSEQWRTLRPIVARASAVVSGASLAPGVCHGDVRLANVRFSTLGAGADGGGRSAATLFDLEAMGLGPALYDVACLWRRRLLESGLEQPPPDWRAFREGYEKRGALGDAAWSLVPALGCLRAFWTMMLPVEPALDWGEAFRSSREYWAGHLAQLAWFDAAMRDPSGWV